MASGDRVPIAIIGYGYRLPGGIKSDDDFWKLISERGFVQEPIENRYGKGQCPHDGFDSAVCKVASADHERFHEHVVLELGRV